MLLMEGIVLCFILLMFCVIGIANGPEKFTVFYEKNVQEKAIKLGYTTQKKNKETNHYINYSFILALFYSCAIDGLLYKWCKRVWRYFYSKFINNVYNGTI